MMNEDQQRALLMAQLNNKRAMKQKYLRQGDEPGKPSESALTGLVMTNVMLLAIKGKVDIFGAIRRIREEANPNGETLFGTVLGWIASLAEVLDCSVYELFIDDGSKRRRILCKLLSDLETCDSWENIRLDQQGNGSFALPGFDYAYRMTEQPSATLLFEKTAMTGDAFRYTLTLGDGRGTMDLIPSQGVLWQEAQGPLQAFTDHVLTDLNSGWPVLKEQFDLVRQQLLTEAEKLRDLAALLEEVPTGLNLTPLLTKETATLKTLREQEKAAYDRMPEHMSASGRGKRVQNALILLGGAIAELERVPASDSPREQLSEIVYMLENAAEPV